MEVIIFIIIIIVVVIGNIGKQQKEYAKRQNDNKNALPPTRGPVEHRTSSFPNKTITENTRTNEIDFSNTKGYVRATSYVGRNADVNTVPSASEKIVTCGYCGAHNAVPINQRAQYSCYFCREKL